MADQVVATRYAQALIGAIEDPGALDTVHEEVLAVAALLEENVRLKTFLEGPNIGEKQKHALLDKVFHGKIRQETQDFLDLLLHKHRISHFADIVHEFTRMVEAKRNQVRVRVTTAAKMPVDVMDRLKRALDVSIGKDCILEPRVDRRVLGGVVAVVGDRVIDGSLRTSLEDLRKQLMDKPLNS